jgi:phosphonate degradation associated HDIG domain protein
MNNTTESKLTLETIVDWLRHRAGGWYGGEVVTQLQHALQCATLAHAENSEATLVVAALLHDLGHVAHAGEDQASPHGELAADLLKHLFPDAVTEPIRMHVAAKRYLCATDSKYWDGLSKASKESLEWQGGPFTADQAKIFIRKPFAWEAVRLRRWDDEAKKTDMATLTLEQLIPVMQTAMRRTTQSQMTSKAVSA